MTFQGSCSDMCPVAERQFRFGLSLSVFEKDKENQPDEYAMVKEYRRSSADQKDPEPSDLRTPEALCMTMDYLVCNIMDDPRSSTKELALEWYDFLWDRLRAIRKDITQQNICDQASAILVERCARFHVHCCYAMNQVKNFDVDMNKRNLNDCLQMLRQMYSDLRITRGTICPGELEFQLYDILLHLNDDHLASTVLMKTSEYRSTNELKFIINIVIAYSNNDYHRFFRLMESANYMTSCLLSLYAPRMRLLGLKSIANACPPRQITSYPLNLAVKLLGFDDEEDLKLFATNLGIEVHVKSGDRFLSLSRDMIQKLRSGEIETQWPFRSRHLVENKADGLPVGLLIDGRDRLPQNPYRANPLSTSQPVHEEEEQAHDQDQYSNEEQMDQEEISSPKEVQVPLASPVSRHNTPFVFRRTSPPKSHPQPPPSLPVASLPKTMPIPMTMKKSPTIIPRPTQESLPKISLPSPPTSDVSTSPSVSLKSTPSPEKSISKNCLSIVSPPIPEEDKEHKDKASPSDSAEEILQRELEMKARREEIADFMPVGRYKIRNLRTKVPTLRPPGLTNGHRIPSKRYRPSSSAQRAFESIRQDIEDEARTNENFKQFVGSLETMKALKL